MKLFISLFLSLTFSFSLFANCPGWHEFSIIEEQDMQFLDSYLARFQPNLDCSQPLSKKQALKAAKAIIAAYKECTLCSEPDVDYKGIAAKIGNGDYKYCTSIDDYRVDPWSWDYLTTLMPVDSSYDGYNLSFIKTARE